MTKRCAPSLRRNEREHPTCRPASTAIQSRDARALCFFLFESILEMTANIATRLFTKYPTGRTNIDIVSISNALKIGDLRDAELHPTCPLLYANTPLLLLLPVARERDSSTVMDGSCDDERSSDSPATDGSIRGQNSSRVAIQVSHRSRRAWLRSGTTNSPSFSLHPARWRWIYCKYED